MKNCLDRRVVDFVRQQAESDAYAAYCRNLLQELLEIDTSLTADLEALRQNEAKVFAVIENELRVLLGDRVTVERQPIDPAIQQDPAYTVPHYAEVSGSEPSRRFEQIYAGRCNLIAVVAPAQAGTTGRAVIYNTHVDTAAPWIVPRTDVESVYGRGACGGKAGVAALLGQIKLLGQVREQFGCGPSGQRVYQFVIDRQAGGNGTLSAVRDPRWSGHEVVVVEPTDNVPRPAGLGELWYRCELSSAGDRYVQPIEMYPFVVHALEQQAQKLRDESRHPLFGPEHIRLHHGVLGCYGSDPSLPVEHVAILITVRASANPERIAMRAIEVIEAALAEYCRTYGDQTKQVDPATGRPALSEHYKLAFEPRRGAIEYRLDVYGRSGPAGAWQACDGAIAKSAYILLALMKVARNYPTIQAQGRLADEPAPPGQVVLEGALTFPPGHSVGQMQARLEQAAAEGVRRYCEFRRVGFKPQMVRMSFARRHNDAYACPVDCPAMEAMRVAFEGLQLAWPGPSGASASGDARLFAARGHNVIAFGPGSAPKAPSPDECIRVRQIQQAVAIASLADLYLSLPVGAEQEAG